MDEDIYQMSNYQLIEEIKKLRAAKLILYSNTQLKPAIHLYKKYGFIEVPLNSSEYQRSNIKMEINLKQCNEPD